MLDCDFLVIGGGQTGLLVTQELLKLHKKVILVEQAELGGSYLYSFDIPRYLLKQEANLFTASLKLFKNYPETHSVISNYRKSIGDKIYKQIQEKRQYLEQEFAKSDLLKIIKGKAEFGSKSLAEVNSEEERHLVTYDQCVIAVGKNNMLKPKLLKNIETGFLHKYNVYNFQTVPKTLGIIGISVESLEVADIYANLGIKVKIFEKQDSSSVLRKMDRSGFNFVIKSLLNKQIDFHFSTNIETIQEQKDKLVITDSKKTEFQLSHVYFDVEENFTEDGLRLDKIGIEQMPTGIIIKKDGRTSVDHIWALGECGNQSTDRIKLQNIFNLTQKFKPSKPRTRLTVGKVDFLEKINSSAEQSLDINIPITRFLGSSPVSTIGLTESEARAKLGPIVEVELIESEVQEGFAKIIYNSNNNEALGVVLAGDYCNKLEIFVIREMTKNPQYKDLKAFVKFI